MNALSDNMRAAILMMLSMSAFTVNDALMKAASDEVPFFQAIALRGLMITAVLIVVALIWGNFTLRAAKRDWGLVALRTAAEAIGTLFFLTALFKMPIANLSAILQALPLTVTLAAALFLREPVGWRRLTAILIGFVGVILIVQPGTDGFSIYSVLGIAAVIAVTVRDLAARKLTATVPSILVALVAAVGVTALALVAGTGEIWVMPSAKAALQLAAAAGCLAVGYIAAVTAMRGGDIGFVAPFRYTSLLVALILGLVFFGEWPNWLTLLGALIVVGTGLFTLYRERSVKTPTIGLRVR
ncbi:DMT family transporter [Octadecabacter sp. SW4]|uniref:DMT family transporter n=1 Tax=Octadecabacter sp. SW4 TaxID=2602067 RepID=UPI0011C20333|nr:DMT family transporter [Octadecabacter sp. SW4]QEE34524.1 DMT family transporter [Octadecabacter sp. SW4]